MELSDVARGLGLPLLAAALIGAGLMAPAGPAEAARPAAREADTARGIPDSALAPRSVELVRLGDQRLARAEHQAAIDAYETALAVDPRNVKAYLGLARAAEASGLPGKAIRYYREALAIDPNDVLAIEAQGLAYLARGAKGRAEANLERLRKICATPCPAADRLAAAVARGGAMAAAAPAPEAPSAAKR
jgi:tetratricopeptide (TPR) repeat protein